MIQGRLQTRPSLGGIDSNKIDSLVSIQCTCGKTVYPKWQSKRKQTGGTVGMQYFCYRVKENLPFSFWSVMPC